jgi:hypothetical protein
MSFPSSLYDTGIHSTLISAVLYRKRFIVLGLWTEIQAIS